MTKNHERGQTMVLMAVFLFSLICVLGIVIDGGTYLLQRRDAQGVADSAAMAAVRELPGNQAQANALASQYVEIENDQDNMILRSIEFDDNSRFVRVVVETVGRSTFSGVLGIDSPTISASAGAKVQMMGSATGMLPFAFMKDSYSLGENAEVKTHNTDSANRGAISPELGNACVAASGSNDFRQLISGSAAGGVDACATEIGGVLDTEPGNMSGPTRQGFDTRLAGNDQSFDEVFEDDGSGVYTVLDSTSPRIGIVPVIENTNSTNDWPDGRSSIRIVSYVLVYIGKTDSAGNPAYTDNGKSVWLTPLKTIMPGEAPWATGENIDYAENLDAPIVWSLSE